MPVNQCRAGEQANVFVHRHTAVFAAVVAATSSAPSDWLAQHSCQLHESLGGLDSGADVDEASRPIGRARSSAGGPLLEQNGHRQEKNQHHMDPVQGEEAGPIACDDVPSSDARMRTPWLLMHKGPAARGEGTTGRDVQDAGGAHVARERAKPMHPGRESAAVQQAGNVQRNGAPSRMSHEMCRTGSCVCPADCLG
jgi:hypothetical protein